MNRIFSIVSALLLLVFITGCHVAQEKAWSTALETTRQKIAADEKLSQNIARIEVERRQFLRIYINKQKVRSNFVKFTVDVGKIFGEALFADPGNTFKRITIFGNLDGGDELIVCSYSKEAGLVVEKDRSMLGM